MTNICMYFQVHQPFRLRKNYTIFDIGKNHDYFDNEKNLDILNKVAQKCYLPANALLRDLIREHGSKFKVAFSISGTALEQFHTYAPDVLQSFQELTDTGNVELLAETSHHSLSFLTDQQEFITQVQLHKKLIKKFFNQKPTVFRNTELIYNNALAKLAEELGFTTVLAEGAEHVLGNQSPNFVYNPVGTKKIKLLLKNYKLSDDIAFRFSDKSWKEHPLTAPKFARWLAPILGDSINLFMDYETFGEHQWKDTGIFSFLKHLPSELFKKGMLFQHPSEASLAQPKAVLDIHAPTSWADIERDTSAWLGNAMQRAAHQQLYKIKTLVMNSNDPQLIERWRKLTTSDHYYYMCTKYFNDGDVHKYFNPYNTPYDCFITFMNVLEDLTQQLQQASTLASTARETGWITIY